MQWDSHCNAEQSFPLCWVGDNNWAVGVDWKSLNPLFLWSIFLSLLSLSQSNSLLLSCCFSFSLTLVFAISNILGSFQASCLIPHFFVSNRYCNYSPYYWGHCVEIIMGLLFSRSSSNLLVVNHYGWLTTAIYKMFAANIKTF